MSVKELHPSDELVRILMKEGNIPENISMLYGFIGEGKNEDTITLYTDVVLQKSIEIKLEDILHSVKVSKNHSPFGGTYIWIKKASEYIQGIPYKSKETQQNVNDYFQGPINNQYAQENQTCCGNCKDQQTQANFTQNCQPTVPPICIAQ